MKCNSNTWTIKNINNIRTNSITQEQRLTHSEELLQQLHQKVQYQQQEVQKFQQQNLGNHQSQPLQGTRKSINRKILGQKLFNAKCFYRFFPGATFKDFLHYSKPLFRDPHTHFDIAALHYWY